MRSKPQNLIETDRKSQVLQHESEPVLTDEISHVLSHNCVDSESKLSLHTFKRASHSPLQLRMPKPTEGTDLELTHESLVLTMNFAFLFFRTSSLTPGSKLSHLKRDSLLVPCSKLRRHPGGQLTF